MERSLSMTKMANGDGLRQSKTAGLRLSLEAAGLALDSAKVVRTMSNVACKVCWWPA
jgi:hypothetical protein